MYSFLITCECMGTTCDERSAVVVTQCYNNQLSMWKWFSITDDSSQQTQNNNIFLTVSCLVLVLFFSYLLHKSNQSSFHIFLLDLFKESICCQSLYILSQPDIYNSFLWQSCFFGNHCHQM